MKPTDYIDLLLEDNNHETDYKHLEYQIVHGDPIEVKFGNSSLFYKEKSHKGINNDDPIMELHLMLAPEDQGKGFAIKMIKAFLYREGGTFYIAYGRIINEPHVSKLIEKIKADPFFAIEEYDTGLTLTEN